MAESSDKSSSTNAATRSGQSLVEDVLREAQALLDDTASDDSGSARPDSGEPDPEPSGDTLDLQALVDRVDGLLGDLGHLADEVEAAEKSPSPGLDLTLVLPPKSPAPEHVVPDLGSAGPQVDLFAAPTPETPAASEATATSPTEVVLETESVSSASTDESGSSGLLDDLSAALAAEFDQPALVPATAEASAPVAVSSDSTPPSGSPSMLGGGFAASPISATEVALMAAMTEEFGVTPTELPPVEDEGDPFASRPESSSEPSDAAKRLEALLAQRLAEEYDLVESASTRSPNVVESASPNDAMPAPTSMPEVVESTADATELVRSDIDAVARAEMEALEALGSELDTSVIASPNEAVAEVEAVPAAPVTSAPEPNAEVAEPVPTASRETPVEERAVEPDEHTADSDTSVEDERVESAPSESTPISEDTDAATPRPKPMRTGPSALVRIGAMPFQLLPAKLHRHVTPVAISLAAWVPLAWGFAILAPKPAPPTIDALPAGIHESSEAAHSTAHPHDEASGVAVPAADHEIHEPVQTPDHDPGHATTQDSPSSSHATSPAVEHHETSHGDHH